MTDELKFFRYESVIYASIDSSDEYSSSNPKVVLREYNLWKETAKGYWIGYGYPDKLHGGGRWVSKISRKRFAYPTKKEALNNFILRNQRRLKILSSQLDVCRISLDIAKGMMLKFEDKK